PPAPPEPPHVFHMQAGTSKVRIVSQASPAATPEPPAMVAAPAPPPVAGHPVAVRAGRSNPEARSQTRPLVAGIHPIKMASEPMPSPERAKDDAMKKVKFALVQELNKLDPPVQITPSLARIQNEYCPANQVKVCTTDDPRW